MENGFIKYLNNDSCEESEDDKSHVRWDERCGQTQNEDGDMGSDVDPFPPEFIRETGAQKSTQSLSQEHERLCNINLCRLATEKSPLKMQMHIFIYSGYQDLVYHFTRKIRKHPSRRNLT